MAEKVKRTLIIGTPRSGTSYISELVAPFGIDIGHEKMGRDGMVDWEATFWDKEPSYVREPSDQNIFMSDFDIVFHQVRHPIPTIESMHIVDENNWVKARACVEQINVSDSKLLACMKFYYYYNLKAEKEAGYQYRIENIKNCIVPMLELIGIEVSSEVKLDIFKCISRKFTNSNSQRFSRPLKRGESQYENVTWELMEKEDKELAIKIKAMARNYGYIIKERKKSIDVKNIKFANSTLIIAKIFKNYWKEVSVLKTKPTDNNRLKFLIDSKLFNPNKINLYFLINELVRVFCPEGVYLEAGIHKGASLISAAYQNSEVRCIGIDHFQLHKAANEDTEKTFLANKKRFKIKNIEYIKDDIIEGMTRLFDKEPNLKIDIFYFDATHEYTPQMDAMNKIKSHIKYGGLICIDDIVIPGVSEAAYDFEKDNPEFREVLKIHPGSEQSYWNKGFIVLEKCIGGVA